MNIQQQMANEPMGDALAYLENFARSVDAPKPQTFQESHPQEAAWINTSTFDFALKMREVLKKWGGLTPGQLAAVRKCMAMDQEIQARKQTPERAPSYDDTHVLDLSKVPSGMYAVPGGDTRLKVQIKHGTGKWAGYIFVSDGATYGNQQRYGMQAPGGNYRGKIFDQLLAIAANPRAASQAYGRLTGHCGVCGRHLEDETSVARGIGPVCAGRMGW